LNTVQRIVKNTAVLFAANIISKVLGFFYVMYSARYLGAEGFGILSFALAFAGIFGVLTDLGLGQLTVREVARDKSLAKKYLNNISVMKTILVTVTFALIVIVINLLGYPEQTIKVVYLISLSVIFNSFTGMFYSIFRAFEKMEYQSLGQILSSVLMLVGVLFAISQRFSVIGFALLYFVISVVTFVYSFAISFWKFGKLNIKIDWNLWKSTIVEALPFGLSAIFIIIYFRIDSVMLSMMKGNEVVGWYSAAYKIIDAFVALVPGIIYAVIYPVLSRHFNSKDLKTIYIKSFHISFILGLFISIFITLFANKIILIIYGTQYTNSVPALKILIWAFFIICISSITSGLLNSINKQRIVTIGTGIGALLNIILNLILIPKYSLNGAAFATVATEFFGFLIYFYFVSKYLNLIRPEVFLLITLPSKMSYIFKELQKKWSKRDL